MRLYKVGICVSGILVLLASCQKNFLDRGPETAISDAEFWKTSNDLKLYCNNFYNNTLPTYGGFGNIGIYGLDADQGSDNMISMGYNTVLNGERTVPASGGGWNWSALRNINYFLANHHKVSESWNNKKTYVGEALFFRAQFYFGMLKTFGALPWINKPLATGSPELFDGKLPRNVIADSIISDLENAISYLPSKSAAQPSRITKEVAMAFQSRVALFEGTWEKYHTGTPFGVAGSNGSVFLQKAATVAEALIGSNVHQLDNVGVANGYWNLFNKTDYSSSKEIMLWRQYDVSQNLTHNWHRYTTSGAGRGLTKNLVDYYLCTDGLPVSVSSLYQGDDSLIRIVRNRDPRLNQTIYVPDGIHTITSNQPGGSPNVIFTIPSFSSANEGKPATGYQLYKGHNSDYFQQYAGNVGTTAQIIFRYAEVLLNFAEAKAELGTITQDDVDKSINKLRQRAGMPNLTIAAITTDPKWEFPALSAIVNEVRRERRVELACEGYRRDDIFRWAAADELIVGWKPKGAKKNQWTTIVPSAQLSGYPVDANGYIALYQQVSAMLAGYQFRANRDYLSPLPTSELTLNPKLAPQNPNW